MSGKIAFEVETARVLEILSKEIYDSPMALLRENLQNAYDATLMRCAHEGTDVSAAEIELEVEPGRLVISDHGIGMTEEVLRNNFWKAGSSGKKTDLARKAGVIGTFGIGAMANFGVCNRLQVETRAVGSDTTLLSIAEKAKLSFAQECIELIHVKDDRGPGTRLAADLETDSALNESRAMDYLASYAAYLPVKVTLNGKPISQRKYGEDMTKSFAPIDETNWTMGGYAARVQVLLDPNGQAAARVTDIKLEGVAVTGDMVLVQSGGQLMGLRNYFGLAPIPVSGHYQVGGFANLSILQPTAGREALSRESIVHVNNLVSLAECAITERMAKTDAADRNTAFQQHVLAMNRLEFADKVTISVQPGGLNVPLGSVVQHCQGKTSHYYAGTDTSIVGMFSGADSCLLHVSQANPRRKLQTRYISQKLSISEVPDKATVKKEFKPNELLREEAAFLARVLSTLSEDYLLADVVVQLADITHGVSVKVQKDTGPLQIWIARDNSAIKPVIATYHTAYEVFGGFVKDYVRNHIYQSISKHVPSSTREGLDALTRVLQRNREMYRYEESELGDIEPLLGDYLAGEISLAQVLSVARSSGRPSTQTVNQDQVGTVEEAIPDVVQSPDAAQPPADQEYSAAPPILRTDTSCPSKILTTSAKHRQLNDFAMFLGLSERITKTQGDFFHYPHTTKIIWAGHRIVYIFSDETGKIALYYDIELREQLEEKSASGGMFPTTTLVLKNRIYVPVPELLEPAFRPVDGAKEFFVRFDLIVASSP